MQISTIVLVLTLLAVLWYSWETRKLRIQSEKSIKLTEKHLELSYMPHLILILQRGGLYLYNIGNGSAVNVGIEDKIVSPANYPERLRFACPPIIKKDECLPIEVKILTKDGKHEDPSARIEFIKPPDATDTIEVTVRFENLVGIKYTYPLKLGKDMPNDATPVDYLLQYLHGKYPKTIEPNEIPAHYVAESERMKVLRYSWDKGLIEASPVKTDQQGIVGFHFVSITSLGIDYLKGKI
jgi:hypothetical protein